MDKNLPWENDFSKDSFKEPDHQLPSNLRTNKGPNENPYSVNLVRDLVVGPNSKSKREDKSNPNKEKVTVFERGIKRSNLKRDFEKMPNDSSIKMDRGERGSKAMNMDRRFGSEISKDDYNRHIGKLNKIAALGKTEEERSAAKHEKNLFEKEAKKKI